MTMPAETAGAEARVAVPAEASGAATEVAPAAPAPSLEVGDVVVHRFTTPRDGETSVYGIVVAVDVTDAGQRAAICRLGAASGLIPAAELRRA
jgi:hypothetical protein